MEVLRVADIHILLSQIRASRGDKYTQQGLNEKKCTEVNLILESFCTILQAEVVRIQSGNFQKLENRPVQTYINTRIKQSIDDFILYYQADEILLSLYCTQYFKTQFLLMSPLVQGIWADIHQFSLYFNFDQIAWMLKDLPSQDWSRIFACLLIQTVQRRSDHRKAKQSVIC